MVDYASDENVCRSVMLLNYFGEKNGENCGQCDVCLKKKNAKLTNDEFTTIRMQIEDLLKNEALSIPEIIEKLKFKEQKIIETVRFLLDNKIVVQNKYMKLELKK